MLDKTARGAIIQIKINQQQTNLADVEYLNLDYFTNMIRSPL